MKASHARRADRRQPSPTDAQPPEPDAPASAEALAARDRTGWPPHPSERRDFGYRIRVFPPEMAGWRKRMLREVAGDPRRFPRAAGATPGDIQARFDDGISYLREVARILAVLYGTPDLGNKTDPTDELVYIILARHTREGAYQQAFDLLKQRFPCWDDLLDAPPRVGLRMMPRAGNAGNGTAYFFPAFPDISSVSRHFQHFQTLPEFSAVAVFSGPQRVAAHCQRLPRAAARFHAMPIRAIVHRPRALAWEPRHVE